MKAPHGKHFALIEADFIDASGARRTSVAICRKHLGKSEIRADVTFYGEHYSIYCAPYLAPRRPALVRLARLLQSRSTPQSFSVK